VKTEREVRWSEVRIESRLITSGGVDERERGLTRDPEAATEEGRAEEVELVRREAEGRTEEAETKSSVQTSSVHPRLRLFLAGPVESRGEAEKR